MSVGTWEGSQVDADRAALIWMRYTLIQAQHAATRPRDRYKYRNGVCPGADPWGLAGMA